MLIPLLPTFSGGGPPVITIPYEDDMDTRMLLYLRQYYSSSNSDLQPLLTRYLAERPTGTEVNQQWNKLCRDATAAMTG